MTQASHTLKIERVLKAPPSAIWRCWSEPDLLMQWFCPKPWQVVEAKIELVPGGIFYVRMQGPNGENVPLPGVLLKVELGKELVFTDAFERAWLPSGKAFMVGDVSLKPAPGNATHYVARAHHWNAEDMASHQAMGFEAGWNAAADQLETLAQGL